jgi:hypothetical protein
VDINAAHAIAWCFSFTMAGTKVTGGGIIGGDGADGGGGGDVVSAATAIGGGGGEVVGVAAIVSGGEAVGDAASGEDVAAAGSPSPRPLHLVDEVWPCGSAVVLLQAVVPVLGSAFHVEGSKPHPLVVRRAMARKNCSALLSQVTGSALLS